MGVRSLTVLALACVSLSKPPPLYERTHHFPHRADHNYMKVCVPVHVCLKLWNATQIFKKSFSFH